MWDFFVQNIWSTVKSQGTKHSMCCNSQGIIQVGKGILDQAQQLTQHHHGSCKREAG